MEWSRVTNNMNSGRCLNVLKVVVDSELDWLLMDYSMHFQKGNLNFLQHWSDLYFLG